MEKQTFKEKFMEAIFAQRPDLRGKPVSFIRSASLAFIADEVFKTNHPSMSRLEVKILRRLEDKKLPVPKVTCQGMLPDEDLAFFGMTRMPGVTLKEAPLLSWLQTRRLSKEIAKAIFEIAMAFPTKGDTYASHNDLNHGNILIDPITKKLTGIIDFEGLNRYRRVGEKFPLNLEDNLSKLEYAFNRAFARRLKKLPQIKKMDFAR